MLRQLLEMPPKITRTWKIDEDVSDRFVAWADKLHVQKGLAAQLGMWLVMGLSPNERQRLISLMDRREPVNLGMDAIAEELGDAAKIAESGRQRKRASG